VIESKRRLLLLGIRWFSLILVLVLQVIGINNGSDWLFIALVTYNAILGVMWDKLMARPKLRSFVLLADILISIGLIWITGGSSRSPYYIYAFSSIMMVVSYFSFLAGLAIVTCFCLMYTLCVFEGGISARLPFFMDNIDTFLGNYTAFYLTAVFFGYPAHVIRKIEEQDYQISTIKQSLEPAQVLAETLKRIQELSDREQEVFSLMVNGKTNAQIAKELFISERTVRNHAYRIYKKLGVGTRIELLKGYAGSGYRK
jgi:DNA-binding CsgD family transcriptional regulator